MAEHVFENSSILLYQVENKYQKLKRETVEKLSILGDKIDQCLDVSILKMDKEENILLLAKSIQLIHQELKNIKDDITLLKEYQK